MFKKYFLQFVVLSISFAGSFKIFAMDTSNPFDAFICVSSEDEVYNVKGGIGTYLGILTKQIKKLYPSMQVYWIAKSNNQFDFHEKDIYGINRYYLSDTNPYKDRPFFKNIDASNPETKSLLDQQVFLNKANKKIGELLHQLNGKKVVIECGEWEGQAHQIFRTIFSKHVLKAARIHTPLAVTMASNKLSLSTVNQLQLMNEFETLYHADCISSCTAYMKEQVTTHLLGENCEKAQKIVVIPNPVDVNNYKSGVCTRKDSIAKVNSLLGQEFITDTTYNIYIIGSVETRKGAELVIDSVAKVAEKIPHARFCFLGHHGGNDSKALTANTKLSPNILTQRIPEQYRHQVAFAGYVSHNILPMIIESGDVFPIMYLGDNFPGTVAEIALMEKPILALSRGGVNEMLQNDAGEMIAYNLGSSIEMAPSNLANGLLDLYDNPQKAKEIGQKLNLLIRESYNPEKVTKALLSFYRTNLAKKD